MGGFILQSEQGQTFSQHFAQLLAYTWACVLKSFAKTGLQKYDITFRPYGRVKLHMFSLPSWDRACSVSSSHELRLPKPRGSSVLVVCLSC